ncbi:7-cyano-7-deazaguanine synthase [Micromonospora sp. CB01531]|uniref:7-cyano-7-deazaguanine synthase n=1 Tax=Micromonospora sp. CB01531 TaxID=1718947 RepID=UPI000A3F1883|nr:7-cyano-7-deazaguanine synthase [Micromonospora sp. CB01531]
MTQMEPATLQQGQARVLEQEVETAILAHENVADCAVVYQGSAPAAAVARACVRCGMDAAYPGADLDDRGTCYFCRLYTGNEAAIHSYFGDVDGFLRKVREKTAGGAPEYDVLLLFSGGKDSTYVLHRLVDLGLRVMTFTFDNGFISQTALRNVENITAKLRIEHVTLGRADQNRVFVESLRQHQSVCNGCFRSLLSLSTELAAERKIPVIVTGLSRGQIIDERLSWFYRRGIFDPREIEEQLAVGRRVYHQIGDRVDPNAVEASEVVDFFRYSNVTKGEILRYLAEEATAWTQPTDTGFCSSNCLINDVGVYVHSAERGYHNYESPTRWEVRLGHLERAAADEELRTPVDIPRVRRMLTKIGYTDPADRQRLGRRLVAYYVASGPVTAGTLRSFSARTLPDFLVPEQWVAVDRIPRDGGVLQRQELPSPAPAAVKPKPAQASAESFPLAPAQQRILAESGTPGRVALVGLPDDADLAKVRRAVLRLMLRHDALRLRFVPPGPESPDGGWTQVDGGIGRIAVPRVDLTGRPEPRVDLLPTLADRLLAQLDPVAGPVVRCAVVETDDARLLLFAAHALVLDVRSFRLLLTDLADVWDWLDDTAPEPPPAGSFLAQLDRTSPPTVQPAEITAVLAVIGAPPLTVDVVDHTAGSKTTLGPFLAVGPVAGPDSAPIRLHYFGPFGAEASQAEPFQPSALPGHGLTALPAVYPLELGVSLIDGRLRLHWTGEPAAGVDPAQIAARLERTAGKLSAGDSPAA